MTDAAAPACESCPWNPATHIARQGELEMLLCECCVGAHDEADGWTVTPLTQPPLIPHAGEPGW